MAKFLADTHQPDVNVLQVIGHKASRPRVLIAHGAVNGQDFDVPIALALHVLKVALKDDARLDAVTGGEALRCTLADHGAEPTLAVTAIRQPGAAVATGGAVAGTGH